MPSREQARLRAAAPVRKIPVNRYQLILPERRSPNNKPTQASSAMGTFSHAWSPTGFPSPAEPGERDSAQGDKTHLPKTVKFASEDSSRQLLEIDARFFRGGATRREKL
jgi:hypothetical protein